MEPNTAAPPHDGGARGGGGKFKKPPARRPPATPYDRPPSKGWIYKLVDRCAATILPSFISNAIALPVGTDKEDPETVHEAGNEERCTSSYVISRSLEGKERDPNSGNLTGISEVEKLEEENVPNSSNGSEISRIEELVQGKTFSRDEIVRLTEILNSQVVDQQENETSRIAEGDPGSFHLTHETPRRDETKCAMPGISTPLPQKNVQDEVGASPIDIAKAYMGNRRLEKGCDSYSLVSKGEQAPRNRFLPLPSPKSSTCWPAAMVQDQRGYTTPQSQRGFGHVDFPRTPYSRTSLPKSKDRQAHLQANNRWPDLSVKPFQQSQSSFYCEETTRTDLSHPRVGSVGPIRRIRNKFGSESRPRRSIFLNSASDLSVTEKVGASKVFSPAVGKNLEVGETSGVSKDQPLEHRIGSPEEAMPLISSSNETVRKILEQLDRCKPTPAEKAAELKLASEWKKYPRNEVSDATPNGKMSSSHSGEFALHTSSTLVAAKSSSQGESGTGSHVQLSHEQTTCEANAVADASAKASSLAGTSVSATEVSPVPSVTFTRADPKVKSFFSSSHTPSFRQDSVRTDNGQKDKDAHPNFSLHNRSNGQNSTALSGFTGFELPRNASGQASGTRPNLPSIFINKPNPRNVTSPDNGFAFSFPVPASSSALSEPPTPSIMPTSSANVHSQPLDALSSLPAYSFGTGKSAQRLIFSFPSTSNTSVPVDASDLKFNFGSERKSRLSFSVVGKAAC